MHPGYIVRMRYVQQSGVGQKPSQMARYPMGTVGVGQHMDRGVQSAIGQQNRNGLLAHQRKQNAHGKGNFCMATRAL